MLPEALKGFPSYQAWLESQEEFRGRIPFAKTIPKAPPRPAPYGGPLPGS